MTPSGPSRRAFLLGVPAATAACATGRPAASPVSSDEERSLATLRVVDSGLPLLSMTLYGPYDVWRPLALAPPRAPFACSLFAARHGPDGPVFGRNFDWDPHPALLLTTRPPTGPATLSMVDLAYLGVGRDAALRAPRDRRVARRLLNAVRLPFDGMNEHGLAIGMASLPSPALPPRLPGRPTTGSVRVHRLVLDRARTVDEAVAVFRAHNVDFTDSPPLHYLVADRDGDAAVLEFVDRRLSVVRGADGWHAMENALLTGTGAADRARHRRYRIMADRLRATGGGLGADAALALLRDVRQRHTRWSAVYRLRDGVLHYTLDRDHARRRTARLAG
ncbi:carcinine hydrolase/isopenicillin-N N-acyltransferase family protein [Actinomadura kijaniata]|uniref:carcinine hydrolase/isopenicillin-N N-acyltransferase family protein n=1 Tax=Actinomadura kijaniata TaxID=46161 RepID=UPI0008337E1C|nr:carcinine hydrolase/isopenicillin-N N-acyltransferase family protein [Actinomadura kijaniata]